jgi:D-alanyl-D-alanine carboxypeptidase
VPSHRAEAPPLTRRRGQRKERRERAGSRVAHKAPQTLALSVPQVGIAGALGLATIAAPLTGVLAVPVAKPVPNTSVPMALGPEPAFPAVRASVSNAVDDVRLIPDDGVLASVPSLLDAPRTVLVARVARGSQRAVLPGCDGVVHDRRMANGGVPAADLCTLWDGKHRLRSDAAVALAKVNLAYHARFGHDMCISDAYRTLAQQYAVKAARGGFAATPGTSEHGWGLAVDLCDGVSSGRTTYWWLRNNAPAYGWDNPDWARAGGSGPHENWHWEYLPGEAMTTPDH